MDRRWVLIVMFAVPFVMEVSSIGDCHAEESLFLDDDPRCPLIYALKGSRHYLDLDSCTVILNDEDGFEISARYHDPRFSIIDHTCRFRRNKESDGKLQVRRWHDSEWWTIYDPYDKETVERVLWERGYINLRLDDYYMFKCVYQELFGKPYEDAFDEEALRRSVIFLRHDGEEPEIHDRLWDDDNFPLIWYHGGRIDFACYIDKSSLFIEEEKPPY